MGLVLFATVCRARQTVCQFSDFVAFSLNLCHIGCYLYCKGASASLHLASVWASSVFEGISTHSSYFVFHALRLVCATSTQEVDIESVKQPVLAVGCEPVPAVVDDPVPAPVLHGGRGNENSWEHDSSGGSRIISNKAQEGPGPSGT